METLVNIIKMALQLAEPILIIEGALFFITIPVLLLLAAWKITEKIIEKKAQHKEK